MTTSEVMACIGVLLVTGLLTYIVRRRPVTPPTAPAPAVDQSHDLATALDSLRSIIRRRIAEGFDSRSEILESALEIGGEEFPNLVLSGHLAPVVDELLRDHIREQATWPEVTDCDRLDQAFALIEKRAIVARQNFACCQNCGHAEIGDQIAAVRGDHQVIGYTFYHMQDTESAAEGAGLHLAYGSISGTDEATLQVAQLIVESLHEAGLKTIWNGELSKRIRVQLNWQRRRPTGDV